MDRVDWAVVVICLIIICWTLGNLAESYFKEKVMYGNMFEHAFLMFALICVVIGVVIGALIFWLIPMFWHWVVPIIHTATA